MKRVLVASILGLAASVVSSYGQANYIFDTYLAASTVPAGQVQWTTATSLAPAGKAGTAVGNSAGFVADLLWSDSDGTGDLGVAVPLSTSSGGHDSYIQAGNVTFDNAYLVGPITFTVDVWSGGTNYVTATARGSLTWTEPGNPANTGYSAFVAMPQTPIYVAQTIPEPATFALAGLGAAALLIFRRRQ